MIQRFSTITSLLALLVVVVLTAGVAQAQRGNFSPEQMKQRLEEQNKAVMAQLELSDEQAPKVTEIMTLALDERMKLMADRTGGGGGFREGMTALDEETTKKLAEVLTEDQLAKYKKILADRPQRRQGGGRPG